MNRKTYDKLKDCFEAMDDCMGQLDYITDTADEYDGCHDLDREAATNLDRIRREAEKMLDIIKNHERNAKP